MPVTSSSRSTAGMTGEPGSSPAAGPVVPSGSAPWAAGMAAMSCSIRAVSLPVWAASASIWSSSIRASSPWWASNRPASASARAACLAFIRPRASPARTCGSRWPAISASIMSRAETVVSLEATADTLIRASSSSFSSRCQYRVCSRVRSVRSRV